VGNKIGKFKCTKCEKKFECMPLYDGSWYVICPFGCTNKILYDLEQLYGSPHYYHVWLNYSDFRIKVKHNG